VCVSILFCLRDHGRTLNNPSPFCARVCVCRRVRKEATVHRNAVLETAAMTAGTLRGVSLYLHHDTLATTPLTGERHLPILTLTHIVAASLFPVFMLRQGNHTFRVFKITHEKFSPSIDIKLAFLSNKYPMCSFSCCNVKL